MSMSPEGASVPEQTTPTSEPTEPAPSCETQDTCPAVVQGQIEIINGLDALVVDLVDVLQFNARHGGFVCRCSFRW